jgi:hypothetical protein
VCYTVKWNTARVAVPGKLTAALPVLESEKVGWESIIMPSYLSIRNGASHPELSDGSNEMSAAAHFDTVH